MLRIFLVLGLALQGNIAAAQDRSGNDTAGEWRPTYSARFGLWDNVCDER